MGRSVRWGTWRGRLRPLRFGGLKHLKGALNSSVGSLRSSSSWRAVGCTVEAALGCFFARPGCFVARRATVEGPASRPVGRPSLTRSSPPPSAFVGAQGGAGRRPGPCRCARQCSDQGCAFIAIRTAMSGRLRRRWLSSGPFPSPGIAGFFLHHAASWPAAMGLVGTVLAALPVLIGLNRLCVALWRNHRYRFTTWRWRRLPRGLLLFGLAMKHALMSGVPSTQSNVIGCQHCARTRFGVPYLGHGRLGKRFGRRCKWLIYNNLLVAFSASQSGSRVFESLRAQPSDIPETPQ